MPNNLNPMPLLTEEELKTFPELTTRQVVPNHVARYWDMVALSDREPAKVIGENAILKDRPGFELEFITRTSLGGTIQKSNRHNILMGLKGYWIVDWENGNISLAPGDTLAVPPDFSYTLSPSMSGEASLFRVVNTDDPAGPTGRLI